MKLTNPFFLSSNEAVATVSSTGLITAIAEGTASIIAKTQDGSKISTCVITVLSNTVSAYFDDCDAVNGWISTATLNNTEHKQGAGCLENLSANSSEFSKVFISPFNSNATLENGQLKLWYWVSLAELGARTVRVEIGSAGRADVDEYQWSMTGLTDGWNQISLNTINASKLGNPDLSAINWFRIYSSGKAVGVNVTTRVDAIELAPNIESAIKSTKANQKSINIYPNPLTKSIFSIDLAGFSGMKNVQIIIVNLLGQIVYQNKVESATTFDINTQGLLHQSVYFVVVEYGNSKITKKLVVNI
jgi:hypothetical protein